MPLASRGLCLATAIFSLIATLVLDVSPSRAQSQDLDALMERLARQPGTTVTKGPPGKPETWEVKRGGVVIEMTRNADKVQAVGKDFSGHGAVLCVWELYISFRSTLDLCGPAGHPRARERLDRSIDAINRFIVANNLIPTTMKEVEDGVAVRAGRYRAQLQGISSDKTREFCGSDKIGKLLDYVEGPTDADWTKRIDDLLLVPRPPVLNPCM